MWQDWSRQTLLADQLGKLFDGTSDQAVASNPKLLSFYNGCSSKIHIGMVKQYLHMKVMLKFEYCNENLQAINTLHTGCRW